MQQTAFRSGLLFTSISVRCLAEVCIRAHDEHYMLSVRENQVLLQALL